MNVFMYACVHVCTSVSLFVCMCIGVSACVSVGMCVQYDILCKINSYS